MKPGIVFCVLFFFFQSYVFGQYPASFRNEFRKTIKSGDLEAISKKVKKLKNINDKYDGRSTVLEDAVYWGHIEVVKDLLSKGADPKIKHYNTLLETAAEQGHLEMVKLLYNKVDYTQQEVVDAMIPFSKKCNFDIVQYLFNKGVDLKMRNRHGRDVLSASVSKDLTCFKFFLQKGADVNHLRISKSDGGKRVWKAPPIFTATMSENIEAIEILLSHGVDLNVTDSEGDTILHLAVERRYADTVQYLVDKGIDINKKNKRGRTALDYAISLREKEIQRILQKANAKKGKEIQ